MKNFTTLFFTFFISMTTIGQTTIDFESGVVNDYFDYDTNLFTVSLNPNFDPYLNPSANISEIRYQTAATGNDAITLKINPVDQSDYGVITFQINIASPFITPATVWLYNDAIGTSSRIEMNNITLNAWNEWFTANIGIDSMDPIGPQYTNYNRMKIFLQQGTDQGNLLFALDNIEVQSHLTLSTNQNEEFNFSYYPNPVKDIIQFQSEKIIAKMRLMNLNGQEILSANINSELGKLDISSIKPGLYLMEIISNDKTQMIKVIKK